MKEFDPATLAQYNGKDGKPIYVAHQGRVFDVSGSGRWKTGTHMKRHSSGKDLTSDISAAPHGPEMLERFPQVGILVAGKPAEMLQPEWLHRLLTRVPILRRHPHPMVVHFPIALAIIPALFLLLYLITGVRSFETTAFQCLGAAIFFIPVGVLSGFFTWWLNYQAKPMKPVRIKIVFSALLLTLVLIAFIWRLFSPDVLFSFGECGVLYFFLVLSFIPVVTVVGWNGAKLTFPAEK